MSRSRTFSAVVLGAVALTLTLAGPARATVMVEVSLEDMARDADVIALGTITRTGDQVVIRERGGVWQGGGHWIDGTPQYRVGEEVVVFLQRDPSKPDSFRTYAMAQGKFEVLRGVPGTSGQVRRDLEGMAFAHWDGQGMELGHAGGAPTMALGPFLDRIREVRNVYGGSSPSSALGAAR